MLYTVDLYMTCVIHKLSVVNSMLYTVDLYMTCGRHNLSVLTMLSVGARVNGWCLPALTNTLLKNESMTVQILFLEYVTWN